MDMKQLLEKITKFAGEPEQKPGEQWKGTDKAPPGKKLVGDSILRDLSKGLTPKTAEQKLAEEWAAFNEEDLGVNPKRPGRKNARPNRGHKELPRYKTVKTDESHMSEKDIELQDYRSMTNKEFQTAYGISKTEWINKYKAVVLKNPDVKRALGVDEDAQGISKEKETKFHKKLDTLVHDTFGKRKEEMKEGWNQGSDRVSLPDETHTYWSGTGALQKEYDELYEKLVPAQGPADTIEGEVLRAASKIVYRHYNDGDEFNKASFDQLKAYIGTVSSYDDLAHKATEYAIKANGNYHPNAGWDCLDVMDYGPAEEEYDDDDEDNPGYGWDTDDKEDVYEARADQVYTVDITRYRHSGDTTRSTSGTIPELLDYFGYTLEVGKSYEHERGRYKINMMPKNINSLVDNLNKAASNAAANGSASTYYSVGEAEVAEGSQSFKKPEPYWVCVDGKKWKRFETYQDARNVHDKLEKKFSKEGTNKKVSLLADLGGAEVTESDKEVFKSTYQKFNDKVKTQKEKEQPKEGRGDSKGLHKKVKIVKGRDAGKTGYVRQIKTDKLRNRVYLDLDLEDGGQAVVLKQDVRLVKDVAEGMEEFAKSQAKKRAEQRKQQQKEQTKEGWESGPEEYKEPYDDADDAYDRRRQEKLDIEAEKAQAKRPQTKVYTLSGRGPNMEPNYKFPGEYDSLEAAVAARKELMAKPDTPHPEHIGIGTHTRYLDEATNNTPLRDKDDYDAKSKALQDIQLDPETHKDPQLSAELAWRKAELMKQAKQLGIEESRAHKVLNTWFKNRESAKNFKLPTPAEREELGKKPAELEAPEKKQVKEYGADQPTGTAGQTSLAGGVNDPKQAQAVKQATQALKAATGSTAPTASIAKALDTASQGKPAMGQEAKALEPLMKDMATVAQEPKLAGQFKSLISQINQTQLKQQQQK